MKLFIYFMIVILAMSCADRIGNENKIAIPIPEMVFVEGGQFTMGSTEGDFDEMPVHKVTLSSFYIGKYEVTQGEYEALMGKTSSHFVGDRRPVDTETWFGAIAYCNALSRHEGLEPCYDEESGMCDFSASGYRLPTEAEWEYAARGGKKSKGYEYSGSNTLSKVAWHSENTEGETHPVGEKRGNELDLHDMSGNVWEFCNDWYDGKYYSKSSGKNPRGPKNGDFRVLRGGNGLSTDCRVALRHCFDSTSTLCGRGFRVVRKK